MNRIFAALPLTCLLVGCGPRAEESTPLAAGSDTSTTIINNTEIQATATTPSEQPIAKASAKTTVAKKAVKATPVKVQAKAGPAKSASDVPDPKYTVVDDGPPGMQKVPPPPKNMTAPAKARVRLVTSKGPITLELNGKEAPLHVKSFLYLSKRGYYNNVRFHRHADLMQGSPDGTTGWIIQGGDPLSKDEAMKDFWGQGGPGYQIPREKNSLKHDRYVIAAARSQDPDSAGSQFYLTTDPVSFLDEGDGYTVFGKITEGQANAKKLREGDVIKSVVILK